MPSLDCSSPDYSGAIAAEIARLLRKFGGKWSGSPLRLREIAYRNVTGR